MDYLSEIFFTSGFDNDYVFLSQRILLFLLTWGLVLYASFLLIVRIAYRNSPLAKDDQLKLSFLWAIGVSVLAFGIFFLFFLKYNGTNIFMWGKDLIGLIPLLLIPVTSSIIYLIYQNKFKKSLDNLLIR